MYKIFKLIDLVCSSGNPALIWAHLLSISRLSRAPHLGNRADVPQQLVLTCNHSCEIRQKLKLFNCNNTDIHKILKHTNPSQKIIMKMFSQIWLKMYILYVKGRQLHYFCLILFFFFNLNKTLSDWSGSTNVINKALSCLVLTTTKNYKQKFLINDKFFKNKWSQIQLFY